MDSKFLKVLFVLIMLCSYGLFAQDTILLKNGTEINARVIEKSDTEIKYMTASDNLVIAIKTKIY